MADATDMIWIGAKALVENTGVIAGAASAVGGGFSIVKWLSDLINSTFNQNNLLVCPYVKSETQQRAEELIPLIEEVISQWPNGMRGKLKASHVQAILVFFAEAYTTATEDKKQELLQNALVNAFDPSLYEAGLTRRMFRLIQDLEYGDIHILQKLVERGPGTARQNVDREFYSQEMVPHHLQILVNSGLAYPMQSPASPYDWQHANYQVSSTELGTRLVKFLAARNGARAD